MCSTHLWILSNSLLLTIRFVGQGASEMIRSKLCWVDGCESLRYSVSLLGYSYLESDSITNFVRIKLCVPIKATIDIGNRCIIDSTTTVQTDRLVIDETDIRPMCKLGLISISFGNGRKRKPSWQ